MTEAVIVASARTAIGTSFKGTLRTTPALDLADAILAEIVSRAGFEPTLLDDVIMGEVQQGGGNIGRHAAVQLGLLSVPGLSHQRQCASSLSSIQTAAAGIMAGMDSAVIAGGVESVSTSPQMRKQIGGSDLWDEKWMPPSHPDSATAPNRDMVDHRRVERRPGVRHHPRADGRVGAALAPARNPGH